MALLNFQKRFARSVAEGTKRQSIRAKRKNPVKRGELLHLYTGLRTAHTKKLGVSYCTQTKPVRIYPTGDIRISGVLIDPSDEWDLITSDGFRDKGEFLAYFCPEGQTFEGDVICWGKLSKGAA